MPVNKNEKVREVKNGNRGYKAGIEDLIVCRHFGGLVTQREIQKVLHFLTPLFRIYQRRL